MTSEQRDDGFVWIWLPGATEPVPAGRLQRAPDGFVFAYGRSYLERDDAVAIYGPELPLQRGTTRPRDGLDAAGCLRDAGPDGWGQRVIRNSLHTGDRDPDLLDFLLRSDSDRFGALDLQSDADVYVPRLGGGSLDDLLHVVDRVDAGERVPDGLAAAMLRGTSIGGARPKAMVSDGGRHLIAKFSLRSDATDLVGAEALGMELARRVGLDVARSERVSVGARSALLVERFDRTPGGGRRRTVSALTILGLSDFPGGRYATYTALADAIRRTFTDAPGTLRELYSRIAFNMCITNTDDHARNHAAFVDGPRGDVLTLTPAYDLEPQSRLGDTAAQAMAYATDGSRATLFAPLVAACHTFLLDADEARHIIDTMVAEIFTQFEDAAQVAGLSAVSRDGLWRRQVLHPSLGHGYVGGAARLLS